MKSFVKKMELETKEHSKIYDVTEKVVKVIRESGFKEGHVLVQAMHTTVGLYVNEGESFLFEDLIRHLNDMAPRIKGKYRHDNIAERDCPPDEPENGHSHIKTALYSNPCVSLIMSNGKLQLGKYQRILFSEFDGPCPRKHKSKRKIMIHIIGD
jgi:secondary thiamine-phosphate synthase enzyme